MTTHTNLLVALGFLLAISPARIAAQATSPGDANSASVMADVPAIVVEGLSASRNGSMRAAVEVWLKDSPVAATTDIDQIQAGLAPVETAYGHVTGYDLLRVIHIGTKVRRVYFVVQYERGPLYGFIDCYQTSRGWVVPGFLTNAQPSVILPPALLAGEVPAPSNVSAKRANEH